MDEDGQPGSPRSAPAQVESPPPAGLGSAAGAGPSTACLADQAARLRADRELRDMLAAQGFAGPAYAVFEEELAAYGYQVMMEWLRTGYIFSQCRNTGIMLLSRPIPDREIEDLALETVAEALGTFRRKGLQEGHWRPDGGASLKTYFTRALCLQFANSWRKRLRAEGAAVVSSLETLPSDTESDDPGPAEIAGQRDAIRRGLADIKSERTRAALVLAADGYEQEEIAEILGPGVTPRSIEGCLRRHRQSMTNGNGDR